MIKLLALVVALTVQESPVDIPKAELPKKAHCVVCTAGGEDHGEEKPAAGVKFKGKSYFFCNVTEVKSFKADPEGFLPPVLPRAMSKIELKDESGALWNRESFKGKVILVDFMASWCKPCHEIKPRLDKLRAELSSKGFEVLSISIDEKRSDLDKFLAKTKFANPIAHDTKQVWADWNVKNIPAMFLVKDGQVIQQWIGKPKKDELENAVKRAVLPAN